MWCMDTDDRTHHVKPGDSGGPVYNVNLADNSANAVGLVVGATEAFKETTGEFFIASCFTSIDRALEGLNATLVTG